MLNLSPDHANEAEVIATFNMSWLVKLVIKRSASSREDLKIAMPFARVRVVLQCSNIKLVKTRDYWTGDYVFHGNWSRKICLSLYFFVQTYSNRSKVNASQRESSQVVGQTRHTSTQVKTCDDLRFRLIRPLYVVFSKI